MSVYLVRHGETEWSLDGRHTGTTDIPLTPHGEQQADAVRPLLADHPFALVLTSPLHRAVETCRRAGFASQAQTRDDLLEWNYGEYEGVTTKQIRESRPDWYLWRDSAPGGETSAEVGARVDRIIDEARGAESQGDTLIFGHGHCLRVLTARWLHFPPEDGDRFQLGTATVSILGYERETSVLQAWNLAP